MYAIPPDIPAQRFFPVEPKMTAIPPVIYSSPWSPQPSETTVAPEFLTQNRSPAIPFMNASPLVAPKSATFPTMMFSSGFPVNSFGGNTVIFPPLKPFPKASFESPSRRRVRPFGINAPNDCPPPPLQFTMKVSSSREFPNFS